MVTYDPRGMNWDQWCYLMCELFSSQQLSILPEDKWQDWADGFAGITSFLASGVPDSRGFDNWQDWAQQLVGIVSINR